MVSVWSPVGHQILIMSEYHYGKHLFLNDITYKLLQCFTPCSVMILWPIVSKVLTNQEILPWYIVHLQMLAKYLLQIQKLQ